MTPENLKKQLLSMGSQAPELKLSLRVILDYLEEHEVRYLSARMQAAGCPPKNHAMALRVAARHLRAFLPNVGNQLVSQIQKGLESFLRHALNPFPQSDPQRALNKLAGLVARKVDLPDYMSLSNRNAHEFLSLLIREMDTQISAQDLEAAVQQVTVSDMSLDSSMVGRLEAELDSMLADISRDPSMGASRGQKKVVRLLGKQGLGDYEALQVFAELVPHLDFDFKIRSDQINSLLSSFLEDSSQRAAAHWR